jgi:hypothetical protein
LRVCHEAPRFEGRSGTPRGPEDDIAAKGREAFKAFFEYCSANRLEDDVNPAAFGDFKDLLRPVRRIVIYGGIRAQVGLSHSAGDGCFDAAALFHDERGTGGWVELG